MFGIDNYYSFLAAVLVFQLVPGPGTIAILNATARHGVRTGMGAVVGTLAGDFVYMAAAVAGLAAVMRTHPGMFDALQWLGVAYLCWMGIRLLLSTRASNTETACATRPGWTHGRQAFGVSLTNPKVILFFVAFFPLFLREDSSLLTLAIMMAHVTALSLLYQTVLVLVGNEVAKRLRTVPFVRTVARRLAGIALIAFGARLALNTR